ncbi:MAG: L,D-transpeptidase family protein [Desulfobacteraceae bacterium]|jgi:murein L,D-transpeptidase YcbB/YkuD
MLPPQAFSNPISDSPEDMLRSWLLLSSQSPSINVQKRFREDNTLVRFYEKHDFKLIWFDSEGITPQGKALLKILANAAREGLNPTQYQVSQLKPIIQNLIWQNDEDASASLSQIIRLDIAFTQSFLKYASDLQHGRRYPKQFTVADRTEITFSPEITAMRLKRALHQGDLKALFAELTPRHAEYDYLRRYLDRYETIRQLGGWQQIPGGPSLKIGIRSPRVPILSRHLLITGDLPFSQFSTQDHFAEPLEKAVRKYQHRNGLKMDGIVGKATLDCLNISVEQRIAQIKLNMERWRWLPPDLEPRRLMVNIPGFELKIIRNHLPQETMRVIVGRKKRQTPLLSSTMTYLEFNPFWNVPSTIARKDILPKIQIDPDYLVKNSIRVLTGWKNNSVMLDPYDIDWQKFSKKYLPYRFRQDPSPHNALGQVKFMFPNHHSIYIHDTPAKSLFKNEIRSFSSGCIRVEDPLRLAHLLLENQQWDLQRINNAIDTQKRRVIVMKEPIPVHLVYFTAWADGGDGTLNFRQDIYGRDQRLLAALNHRAPQRLWCAVDHQLSGNLPHTDGRARCTVLPGTQAVHSPAREQKKI